MAKQRIIQVNDDILISPYVEEDVEELVRCLQDKRITDLAFLPHPYTYLDGKHWIQRVREQEARDGWPHNQAIRNAKGALIGGIGIMQGRGFKSHVAEIGYWIVAEWSGKGHMTEAITAFGGMLFDRSNLVKLFANVYEGNTASIRVLEKAGYKLEGEFEKHYFKDGKYLDAKQYAIIKHDIDQGGEA